MTQISIGHHAVKNSTERYGLSVRTHTRAGYLSPSANNALAKWRKTQPSSGQVLNLDSAAWDNVWL